MNKEQDEIVLRVTAHYVEEVQAGHHPDISGYLARYPQYADAIAAFIAYYQTVELPSSQLTDSTDFSENAENAGNRENAEDSDSSGEFIDEFPIAVETAWQRVMMPEIALKSGDVGKIDHEKEMGEYGEVKEEVEVVYGQPIQSIFMAAKQQRLSPSQLAAYLNMSEDIVTLLDQRALAPESIPLELCRRLAATLHQPLRAVQGYFGMGSRQQVAEHPGEYAVEDIENAEDTREALRVSQKASFREALDNSGKLSAEQTNFWRDVLTKEGL